MNLIEDIIKSWNNKNGNINDTRDIILWIDELNKKTFVKISEKRIDDNDNWFYDSKEGIVKNSKNSFFFIQGIKCEENGKTVIEQPIINQNEIGFLGIITKRINGQLNFLMQAKIEPGNINCVQISPTLQATKSNFNKAHGGATPKYFEYFINPKNIIYDQIQSEQGSRFYKKRNRNIIILIEEDLEVYSNFKWMTLGQIKELMKINNLVNMDTRSVLSGVLPINYLLEKNNIEGIDKLFYDKSIFNSLFNNVDFNLVKKIYTSFSNFKMFNNYKIKQVSLNDLKNWEINNNGIKCKNPFNFEVKYYDVEIEGREVLKWSQPLVKSLGMCTLGLISKTIGKSRKFLVKLKFEIGNFDFIELGPTIQWEPEFNLEKMNHIDELFKNFLDYNKNIEYDVILSEEGGRFYHEENRNVIINLSNDIELDLPDNYFWVDLATINYFIHNKCVNIQLRNLVSLISI